PVTKTTRFSVDWVPLAPTLLLWTASVVAACCHLAVPLADEDLWWHLANGRFMALHHTLLSADVFSHTLTGAAWLHVEWLGQLLLYGAYDVGGWPLLFYGKLVLSFAAVAALVFVSQRAGARGGAVLLAVAWWSFWLLRPRLFERIELVTLIGLPLVI